MLFLFQKIFKYDNDALTMLNQRGNRRDVGDVQSEFDAF